MHSAWTNACFDFDGVLVQPREEAFCDFVRHVSGIGGGYQRYLETNCWNQALGLGTETVADLFDEFVDSPTYYPPGVGVPGAAEALTYLQSRCWLHIVTSRPDKQRAHVFGELQQNLRGVLFMTSWFRGWGRKAELVQRCRGHVLVEDNLQLADEVAAKAKVPVIIFPGPANIAQPRRDDLPYPAVTGDLGPGMTAGDWCSAWREAWEEIPALIEGLRPQRVAVTVPSLV